MNETMRFRLVYWGKQGGNRPLGDKPLRLRKVILEVHHDPPLGAHLKPQKMISVMRAKKFWPSVCRDVDLYCRSCDQCPKTIRMTHPVRPSMMLCDPAERPWHKISMDALERFPRSRKGNRHLVVVVDYYSRFVILIAYAVANLMAKTIADKFVDNVICRVGGVQRIMSDKGKCFVGAEFRILCEKYKISQSFSSVAHS